MQLKQWTSLLTTTQLPLNNGPGSPAQISPSPAAAQFLQQLKDHAAQQEKSQEKEPQFPKLDGPSNAFAKRQLKDIASIAERGMLRGIGVFWADSDGYHYFIDSDSLANEVFAMHGYIESTTTRSLQKFIDRNTTRSVEQDTDFEEEEDDEDEDLA